MRCEEALALLSARLDREVGPDEAVALDHHINLCPECRAVADALREQHADLRQVFAPRRAAVVANAEAVVSQLQNETTVAPAADVPAPTKYVKPALWAAAAIAALVVINVIADRIFQVPTRNPFAQIAANPTTQPPDHPTTTPPSNPTTPPGTAQARSVPAVEKLATGQKVETGARERRRVSLADGSVLYVNENTTLTVPADRKVRLDRGEVFVEVSPRPAGTSGATFEVETPKRTVAALGTKFAVRADTSGTGVVVTQGKVKVNDTDDVINAGQQLSADASTPKSAPRASHALNWTRDLMLAAESPLVPASKFCGGALVAVEANGQEANLPMRKMIVDVHIEDGFARTTIDQTFFNETHSQLEGTFHFPLPADASLSRLAMYVNGDLMEGGMSERDHARQVFETIRYTRRDPALLEWVDGSTFKMRVFPLEPRQEKRIILSYSQRLESLYGTLSYRFPAGHTAKIVDDWAFHARIKGAAGWSWQSTSHDLKSAGDGDDLVLDAAAKGVQPNKDVTIRFTDPAALATGTARFSSAVHEGKQYAMLRYRPQLDSSARKQRRDWVFLVETSADRDPVLARTQIEVMRTLLSNAEHDDTFTVITAGTRVRRLTAERLPATAGNIDEVLDQLGKVQLIGALDMGKALEAVGEALAGSTDACIVHLGSGVAALGERRPDILAKSLPERVPYVGVGVGKRWARGFMKQAAERSGGVFTQINPDEGVRWRAFELAATLNTPRLLNVQVVDNDEKVRFLVDTAMVAQGEELCAVGRLDGPDGGAAGDLPKSLTIRGTLDGQPFTEVLPVADVQPKADYLPRTWAKQEIDRLLAENAEKNKPAIVAMSKAMYVMTPYTSLLVLETEAMYKQFNVDRGRKDHWAMYPAPQKIEVKYEPVGGVVGRKPAEEKKTKASKKTDAELLATFASQPSVSLGDPDIEVPTPEDSPTPGDFSGIRPRLQSSLGHNDKLFRETGGNPVGDKEERTKSPNREAEHALTILAGKDRPRIYTYDSKGILKNGDEYKDMPAKKVVPTGDKDGNWPDVNGPAKPPVGGAEGLWRKGRAPQGGKFVPRGTFTHDLDIPIQSSSFEYQRFNMSTYGYRPFPGGYGFGCAGAGVPGGYGFAGGQAGAFQGGFGGNNGFGGGFGGGGFGGGGFQGNLNGFTNGNPYLNYAAQPGMADPRKPLDSLATQRTKLRLDERTFERGTAPPSDPKVEPSGRPGPTGTPVPVTTVAPTTTTEPAGGVPVPAPPVPSLVPGTVPPPGEPMLQMPTPPPPPVEDAVRLIGRDLRATLSYEHPSQAFAGMSVGSLVSYAPGLSNRPADILHVLETEGEPTPHGKVDPAATALIEKARALGWEKVAMPKGSRITDLVVDGQGRFRYNRTLSLGLKETVLNSGKVQWEVYDELGLASRREVTRFTREELQAIVPWLVSPSDDLAAGCDVSVSAERTVRTAPIGAGDKPHSVIDHVFADDGRLNERRWLLMPEKKVLLREEYHVDGMVRQLDGADKILVETKYGRSAGSAPSFRIDTDKTVLVPMPVRTPEHTASARGLNEKAQDRWTDEDALVYLVSRLSTRDNSAWNTYQGLLRTRRPGWQLGVQVLLSTAGQYTVEGLETLADKNPTAAYIRWRSGYNMDWKKAPVDTFIGQLARCQHILNRLQGVTINERRKAATEGLNFAEQHAGTVEGWAVLTVLAKAGEWDAPMAKPTAELWEKYADLPGAALTVRYEVARSLLKAGKGGDAADRFTEWYRSGIEARALPPIDADFQTALRTAGKDGPRWKPFIREMAKRLVEQKRRPDVVLVAWQCQHLGDEELGNELLTLALEGATPAETPVTAVAIVECHRQRGRFAAAEKVLDGLLTGPASQAPELWHLAALLAAQRKATARQLECLDKALELEHARLPQVFDLEQVRQPYQQLLMGYTTLLDHYAALEVKPPTDLSARVVRAADRWRSLDADNPLVYQVAATLLGRLGETELAWDYRTTPVGLRPNEAEPLSTLAAGLAVENRVDEADRLYGMAFDSESTNAQILWDRATMLENASRPREAMEVYRRLATTEWQPRFQPLREQARQRVGGHEPGRDQ